MGAQLPAGRNARRRPAQTQLHICRTRQGGLRTSLRQARQDALASRLLVAIGERHYVALPEHENLSHETIIDGRRKIAVFVLPN
jgi:hypothetical protein